MSIKLIYVLLIKFLYLLSFQSQFSVTTNLHVTLSGAEGSKGRRVLKNKEVALKPNRIALKHQ